MDVLESMSFLAVGLGETTATLDSRNGALHFIFDLFKDDGEESIVFTGEDNNTLRIRMGNWNSPMGATLVDPIEVGIYESRKLFLLPQVKKIGSKGEIREVNLTFYLGALTDVTN